MGLGHLAHGHGGIQYGAVGARRQAFQNQRESGARPHGGAHYGQVFDEQVGQDQLDVK